MTKRRARRARMSRPPMIPPTMAGMLALDLSLERGRFGVVVGFGGILMGVRRQRMISKARR